MNTVPHFSAREPYMVPSTPKFRHMYESDGSSAKLSQLAQDELYQEIVQCGVPLLSVIECVARGWAHGNPLALVSRATMFAACDKPDASVLTEIGSDPIPLNFLWAFATASGIGKGLTMGARMSCADPNAGFKPATPGSGEQLIEEFYTRVPKPDGQGGEETVRDTLPVWANWHEVDSLAAKSQGNNSTLDSNIRSLFSGEQAGDKSIARAKSGAGCIVEAGTYRFVLSVGAQLAHCAVFLQDKTGGTLQRLLWTPLFDDDAVPLSEARKYRAHLETICKVPAGRYAKRAPSISVWGPSGDIEIIDEINDLLFDERTLALKRDESVDPLDTHSNNNKVRLAAVFAGWRAGPTGKVVIDWDAWYWASCVIEVSKRTREEAEKESNFEELKDDNKQGTKAGNRDVARKKVIADQEESELLRVRAKCVSRVTSVSERNGKGPQWSELRCYLRSGNERKIFDNDVKNLVEAGALLRVKTDNVLRFEPGDKDVMDQVIHEHENNMRGI